MNTYNQPQSKKVIVEPTAIHEQVKHERVQEVQPVYNIERQQTEVHQKTQPLLDKEIKPVQLSQRTTATEVLPDVVLNAKGVPSARDTSTINVQNTSMSVEKPAVVREVDKKKVIEEIQPVVYKETVVPSVLQETRPVFQRVVEGPTYSQETLAPMETSGVHAKVNYSGSIPQSNLRSGTVKELATEVKELPTAIHERVRQEKVTEVQPVVNVEKVKTEVHQKTQPVFDKEFKPVHVEQRNRATQVLPEVHLQSKSAAREREVSTLNVEGTTSMTVEKPAIFNETEKVKVIDEIQPVLYKQTIVPEVIQETQPVFQKIVEGPTFTHETLPPKMLGQTNYSYPVNSNIKNESISTTTTSTAPSVNRI